MSRFFLQGLPLRLVSALPLLFAALGLTFFLMRILPGDPVSLLASSPSADAEQIEVLRHELGLDKGLLEQFAIYLKNLAKGDLGYSFSTGQAVSVDLMKRLPASLELSLCAFLVAFFIAIPLGVSAALRRGTIVDHLVRAICAFGISMPTFVSGLLLVYVFYYRLGWAPDPTGRFDIFLSKPTHVTGFLLVDSLLAGNFDAFGAAVKQLALPVMTLAIFIIAPLARVTRASMISVLESDYIRTASALGLPHRQVIFGYALENAILPVLTLSGSVVAAMLGASVLIEKVFSWPGIGSYAVDALAAKDYAPVQGFVLMMAAVYIVLNMLTDMLYTVFNPQVTLK